MHHIAVLHDVVLALKAHFARFFRPTLAAARDVVLVANHLGADEAALKVVVDHARGLRSFPALRDRPRAHLHLASGEVADEAKLREGALDDELQPALHPSDRLP